MGLDTVELVMAIEEEFGMKIPNEQAARLETAGDLSSYVQRRLESDRGQPLDAAERVAVWERVKAIVVEQLGVEPERVTQDAHIVLDLGAD
jgi:acyl carrier protein